MPPPNSPNFAQDVPTRAGAGFAAEVPCQGGASARGTHICTHLHTHSACTHTSLYAPPVGAPAHTRLPRPRPCLARWPHPENEQNPSGLGSGRRAGSLELKREMRGPPGPAKEGRGVGTATGPSPNPSSTPWGVLSPTRWLAARRGAGPEPKAQQRRRSENPRAGRGTGSRVHGASGAGGVDTPLGSLHPVVTQHTSTPESGHKRGEAPAGPDPGEVLWPKPKSAITHPHRTHPDLNRGRSPHMPSSGVVGSPSHQDTAPDGPRARKVGSAGPTSTLLAPGPAAPPITAPAGCRLSGHSADGTISGVCRPLQTAPQLLSRTGPAPIGFTSAVTAPTPFSHRGTSQSSAALPYAAGGPPGRGLHSCPGLTRL